MNPARISVAVAACDRPEGLARCLDGLAAGTVLPLEVVVVDQGSDPRVEEAVRSRSEALPGLRRVSQERRGLSASRNLAVRETTGGVLAVTDDDCVPDPGWIEAIARALRDEPQLGAVTGPMLPLGPPASDLVPVSSRLSLVRRDWRGPVAPWLVGTGANMAIDRSLLEAVGGWDERLGVGTPGRAGEDLALIDRLLAAGATIRYEPEAVVRHQQQPLADRWTTRGAYGRGAGAWCGILARDAATRHAGSMLARWVALRLRLAAAAAARGRPAEVASEAHVLAGSLAGLLYGLSVGRRR